MQVQKCSKKVKKENTVYSSCFILACFPAKSVSIVPATLVEKQGMGARHCHDGEAGTGTGPRRRPAKRRALSL